MATDIEDHDQPSVELATIALLGNPNTGKTTLFNAQTGQSQRDGNFPGVTVERKEGKTNLPEKGEVKKEIEKLVATIEIFTDVAAGRNESNLDAKGSLEELRFYIENYMRMDLE